MAASNFQTVLEKALTPPYEKRPGGWVQVNDERLANALAKALPDACVHRSENLFKHKVNGIDLEWIIVFADDIWKQIREDRRKFRANLSLDEVLQAVIETPADELKAEIVARCLQ